MRRLLCGSRSFLPTEIDEIERRIIQMDRETALLKNRICGQDRSENLPTTGDLGLSA
jgi:hypothetical protein